MNLFDDENKIIEYFQLVDDKEIFFPEQNDEIEILYKAIHDKAKWEDWTYCAGKNDPPPDYYNCENAVMMDVMRIDDHAFISGKGKIVNPTNAQESKARKEIEKSGLLDVFPAYKELYIIPSTSLPTEQDHNYVFYKSNFTRVVDEHSRKVDLYKRNHPGFKTAFFVLDESSGYFEMSNGYGDNKKGKPHLFFYDQAFCAVIRQAPIDYFIWYAPFKLLKTDNGIVPLPIAVVYDVKKMKISEIKYDPQKMLSSEK